MRESGGIVSKIYQCMKTTQELIRIHNDLAHKELVEIYNRLTKVGIITSLFIKSLVYKFSEAILKRILTCFVYSVQYSDLHLNTQPVFEWRSKYRITI